MAAATIAPLPWDGSLCCPVPAIGLATVFAAADRVAGHRAHASADQGTFRGVTALVTDDTARGCATECSDGGACSGIGAAAAGAGEKGKTCQEDARNGSDFHFHRVICVVAHTLYIVPSRWQHESHDLEKDSGVAHQSLSVFLESNELGIFMPDLV